MVRIISLGWLAIRLATPWIVRVFLVTVMSCLTALAGFWIGVPAAVDKIANEWLDRAVLAGFPTQWDRYLYWVLRVLAFLTIVFGWIVLSFITVFIVKRLF